MQPGGQYKLYPRSVSTPIDEASISLIFRKIPVMVRCIVAGLERGEGFAQLWNFSNFLGKTRPPMHVNPKIKLRKRRCAQNAFWAGPQTKLRTDRKLPVLYYISYGYVFPHTNHHSKKSARADTDIGMKRGKLRASSPVALGRDRMGSWMDAIACDELYYVFVL